MDSAKETEEDQTELEGSSSSDDDVDAARRRREASDRAYATLFSSDSDSDSDVDVNQLLAKANAGLKPSVVDKAIRMQQDYKYKPVGDISEFIVMEGRSRYLFVKDARANKGLIVLYMGEKAVYGQHPGDVFGPNTLRRCHLTMEETRILEKTFQVRANAVVSLDNETHRAEWRERLATYFLLLESNMFSRYLDVEDKAQRQEFLYTFAMSASPMDKRTVARKFKRSVVRKYGDLGVMSRVETIDSGPKVAPRKRTLPKLKKRRILTTSEALRQSKVLDYDVVRFAPKEKEMTTEDFLRKSQELGYDIVQFAPEVKKERKKQRREPTTDEIVQQSQSMGFDVVQYSPKINDKMTTQQALQTSKDLNFDVVMYNP